MIQSERIKKLNAKALNRDGLYVLYWMQQSQRTINNHALNHARDLAADLGLPLVVWFGLTTSFPAANLRHYHFMLQGLQDIASDLAGRDIGFIVEETDPAEGVVVAGGPAAVVVTDAGYLRMQREWRRSAADTLTCPLVQVESDVVVPVETASGKEEYSAATIRKKIHRCIHQFLKPAEPLRNAPAAHIRENAAAATSLVPAAGPRIDIATLSEGEILQLLAERGVDTTVQPVDWIRGGQREAQKRLDLFLSEKLSVYDTLRNDPSRDIQSDMSPFLHFGQISSQTMVLKLLEHESKAGRAPFSRASAGEFRVEALSSGAQAFIEELVIRRELSANFCLYNPHYDSVNALPSWALESLAIHEKDRRDYIYSIKELEEARTHDRYWNAAAREMYRRGKMHGYMRMYWGKKIIEWSKDTSSAYSTMLYLNNKYFLDGRDINSYAGVAWCFGKHDRPWKEREIFGKIRYMNARGLERKFDIKSYAATFGD